MCTRCLYESARTCAFVAARLSGCAARRGCWRGSAAFARFTWRRVSRRVVRAEGPERLSPEWWRPRPDGREVRTRDYYRVEDGEGGRYWLFREGLYGREEGRAPSWWMHGVLP